MADLKTTLRELSVATYIALVLKNEKIPTLQATYDINKFLIDAQKLLNIDLSAHIKAYHEGSNIQELSNILTNGYRLGEAILISRYFKFKTNDPIRWVGGDIKQKYPFDLLIGDYGFSLKEESFIIQNMGLYSLINLLTGSNYHRGLHLFNTFAKTEYDEWFNYTWKYLIGYLNTNGRWELNNSSIILRSEENLSRIVFIYNGSSIEMPIDISTNKEFMACTKAIFREKVFSKWIKDVISYEIDYKRFKQSCAETAGKNICSKINREISIENIYEFFRVYDQEYYYAKSTSNRIEILKVPSAKNFTNEIVFDGCKFEVPFTQLNIITSFLNKKTKRHLEFRNECRFSHGQFNGTPEAKMYISRNSSLCDLYEPIKIIV